MSRIIFVNIIRGRTRAISFADTDKPSRAWLCMPPHTAKRDESEVRICFCARIVRKKRSVESVITVRYSTVLAQSWVLRCVLMP